MDIVHDIFRPQASDGQLDLLKAIFRPRCMVMVRFLLPARRRPQGLVIIGVCLCALFLSVELRWGRKIAHVMYCPSRTENNMSDGDEHPALTPLWV